MFYGTLDKDVILPIDENAQLAMPINEFCACITLSESYLEDFETLNEGANIEITKKCRAFFKSYKQNIKTAKSALKSGDKKTAKANIKEARADLEKFKKEVDQMDSSAGSAIFGFFAHGLVQLAKDAAFLFGNFGLSVGSSAAVSGATTAAAIKGFLTGTHAIVIAIGTLGMTVANVATWIYGMYNLVVDIIKIVRSIDKGDNSADALNLYRVEMLKVCDKFDRQLGKLEKML